jgi:hypothetical protein
MVIWGFDVWCFKEIEYSNEDNFDVDSKWFSCV